MDQSTLPLIGITGRRGLAGPEAPEVVANAPVEVFLADFAAAVARAGGLPIQLSAHADPGELVDRLDGLIIAGGVDVDPRLYGAAPGPSATPLDPVRDAFELALARAAWSAGLPVLDVCRGCQIINVSRGGTLVPDLLPDAGEAHSFLGYPRGHRSQAVELSAGSVPHGLFGARVRVNSFHHQAVAEPGDGLRIVSRAADGVVEAIEADGVPVLGVRWHPEFFTETDPLFHWLVRRARTTDRRGESRSAAIA